MYNECALSGAAESLSVSFDIMDKNDVSEYGTPPGVEIPDGAVVTDISQDSLLFPPGVTEDPNTHSPYPYPPNPAPQPDWMSAPSRETYGPMTDSYYHTSQELDSSQLPYTYSTVDDLPFVGPQPYTEPQPYIEPAASTTDIPGEVESEAKLASSTGTVAFKSQLSGDEIIQAAFAAASEDVDDEQILFKTNSAHINIAPDVVDPPEPIVLPSASAEEPAEQYPL